MTTVVATLGLVAGDSALDSGNGSVPVQKIARIRGSLWGVSGSYGDALRFLRWVRGGMKPSTRPDFGTEEKCEFDAVQVTPTGIVLWDQDCEPMPTTADFHAVGSGGDFALGALDGMDFRSKRPYPRADGVFVKRALQVAASRDGNTRPPFHFLAMSGDSWIEPSIDAR